MNKRREIIKSSNIVDDIAASTSKQLNRFERKKLLSCTNCTIKEHLAQQCQCYAQKRVVDRNQNQQERTNAKQANPTTLTDKQIDEEESSSKHQNITIVQLITHTS
jgi:hypothetical protein